MHAEDIMFAVVAVTAVGWLFVFAGLLAAPPSARWRDRGPGYGDAQESPAVVSLLAEAQVETLPPHEQRVVTHVAARAAWCRPRPCRTALLAGRRGS